MVQKTVKLLIFLNHNLVGFKNTRTFVLKEKGRFFGAIPSIFPLHQQAIIHSKNMRIASPFAVASRARTYYIHMKCFCCPFRAKSGWNTWHPGCCPTLYTHLWQSSTSHICWRNCQVLFWKLYILDVIGCWSLTMLRVLQQSMLSMAMSLLWKDSSASMFCHSPW